MYPCLLVFLNCQLITPMPTLASLDTSSTLFQLTCHHLTFRAVSDFVEKNTVWVQQQVAQNPGVLYWQRVGSLYDQLEGLAAGYNSVAPQTQQLSVVCSSLTLSLCLSLSVSLSVSVSVSVSLSLFMHISSLSHKSYGSTITF